MTARFPAALDISCTHAVVPIRVCYTLHTLIHNRSVAQHFVANNGHSVLYLFALGVYHNRDNNLLLLLPVSRLSLFEGNCYT